ncbi:uncharacterized protein LOC115784343 [Archocentrus centrarchus]|uniref:uncharacterized protein LOC115784343 n=1 Tax=Archocentrus centrarchus TaxID=63155 RepID=UPI0011E9C4EF|nr:uncharacterized protein LOC115784343 [Archocentrus centrarchus]
MNSLVGYGVSSDSDSDGDAEDVNKAGSVEEAGDEAAPVKKTRNFLLESGSASSESEPEDEDPESSTAAPLAAAQVPAASVTRPPKLPTPSLDSITSKKLPSPPLNASSDTSVFANPFKAQADQKLSALQKHVPLTMQAKPSQIGGKRICLSYRKDGRCRFGIKCKFAHDSDLQTPAILTDFHPPVSEETPEAEGSSSGGRSQSTPREIKEEEAEGQQVKKKRVGLSDSLIPPKRAMKQFTMQRDRERANMS